MRSQFANLRVLVLPAGATTGTRIVIDGVNGTITGYDANDDVTFQFTGDVSTFGPLTGARVEIVDGTFNIYDSSDNLVAMVSEDGFTAINPFTGSTGVLSPTAGGGSAAVSGKSETTAPGTTDPTPSLTLTGTDNLELRLALVCPGVSPVGTSFTPPATYTERADISGPTERIHSTVATKAGIAAGASGIQNFTSSFNFSNAQDYESGFSVGLVSSSGTPASFRAVSTATQAGFGTLTVTKPAGVVDGDVLIMQLAGGGPGSSGSPPNLFAPAGWDLLQFETNLTTNARARHHVYYRVANGEPASYDVSMQSVGGTPTSDLAATIVAIQNTDFLSSSQAGLVLGNDTNLYRFSSGVLATDDDLQVGGQLTVISDGIDITGLADFRSDTNFRADLQLANGSQLQWTDVVLARGAADSLTIDGFTLGNGLRAAPFNSTSNNGAHSSTTTTDMVLNNISVIVNHWYEIWIHTQLSLSGTGVWTLQLLVNGSNYDRLFRIDQVNPVCTCDAKVYWQAPATASTDDFAVEANEASGTASLTLVGAATSMRWMSIKDVGQ